MTLALLASMTVKASVVLAAGVTAAALLPRSTAALRHWVLAVAICGALAVPLLWVSLPSWRLALPGATGPVASVPDESPRAASGQVGETLTFDLPATVDERPAAARGMMPWLLRLVLPVWIAGALGALAWLGIGLTRLQRVAARSAVVHQGPWADAVGELARRAKRTPRVVLLQSDHPAMLATWGIRPRILLPAGAGTWKPERIRTVLAHELAHIERRDWLVQCTADVARALLWFNPLAWIASARLRLESERACDDAVLATGIAPPEYAACLVDVARTLTRVRAWLPAPGMAMARTSTLERRVNAMLDNTTRRRPLTRYLRATTLSVFGGLTVFVATLAGQSTFGTVSGTVRDQLGGTLPNVTVSLVHAASGARHEIRTNERGAFEMVGLVAGNYTFGLRLAGFKTLEDTLQLAGGQTLSRNVTLPVGTLQETIRVVSAPSEPRPPRPPSSRPSTPASCAAQPNSGHIVPPMKVADKRPEYPAAMRTSGTSGRVEMKAFIGTDGTVRDVQTIAATNAEFDVAAREAVRQWKFTQTLLNCVPIEVEMNVMTTFDPAAAPPPPPPAPPAPAVAPAPPSPAPAPVPPRAPQPPAQ